MQTDQYGQQIRSESELIDHIMSGGSLGQAQWLTDSEIDLDSIRYLVDQLPRIEQVSDQILSVAEFDQANQSAWLMPAEYHDLDIVQHILDLCQSDAELQRCGEELLLYAERDMLDLLRYLVYLVDTMRKQGVLWGVGRGSSVSSFVLFKLGVHRINSLYYDLDIREFLR